MTCLILLIRALRADLGDAVTLARAIPYAIERQRLLVQLENSQKEIKVLRGMLPICANCKKIRDVQGSWRQMEMYIRDHSEAEFSHGICPACNEKVLRELEELKRGRRT